MTAWNLSAENLPDLLGMITAKGQETGVAVSSLMDKVLDNNAIFKEMGLSLEESISLMAQFEKNGINDSTALAALKTSVKNATQRGQEPERSAERFCQQYQERHHRHRSASKSDGVVRHKGRG